MKILFLAPATNYHTKKWCAYFAGKGYDVHVASLTSATLPNVEVHNLLSNDESEESDIRKLRYVFAVRRINVIYKEINPDIVSVHYATSYGFLAALSNINKYSLSVWGTDVYAFPRKSFFHKLLVKFSLRKASVLLSTSKAMADECRYLTDREFYITPFGVDMNDFNPSKRERREDCHFVISNMKSLSPEYGTDVLLRAIKETIDKRPQIPIYVYIAGEGPSAKEYKQLSLDLKLDTYVKWLGLVPQDVVIKYLVNSDIAVIPSYRESFGVSAVEAQACEIPVIITDVPGLKEATCPEISSIVVPKGDYNALSNAILELYDNKEKRLKMGKNARIFVRERFEYEKCFNYIESILRSI